MTLDSSLGRDRRSVTPHLDYRRAKTGPAVVQVGYGASVAFATSPWRTAYTAAWMRFCKCNLSRMLLR
jgi:hypothetical protein